LSFYKKTVDFLRGEIILKNFILFVLTVFVVNSFASNVVDRLDCDVTQKAPWGETRIVKLEPNFEKTLLKLGDNGEFLVSGDPDHYLFIRAEGVVLHLPKIQETDGMKAAFLLGALTCRFKH
jgi:hypothetical protein